MEAGIYYTRHTFKPRTFSLQFTSTDPCFFSLRPYFEDIIKDTASQEAGGYLEDRKISITDNLKAAVGFHVNQYSYEQKSYFSARINVSYKIDEAWLADAAYTKMRQNLQAHHQSDKPAA